jgi:hypothetical protein
MKNSPPAKWVITNSKGTSLEAAALEVEGRPAYGAALAVR